jgi:hypothetical protein
MQIGSAWPGFVWGFELPRWDIFAPPLAAAALVILIYEVSSDTRRTGTFGPSQRIGY